MSAIAKRWQNRRDRRQRRKTAKRRGLQGTNPVDQTREKDLGRYGWQP